MNRTRDYRRHVFEVRRKRYLRWAKRRAAGSFWEQDGSDILTVRRVWSRDGHTGRYHWRVELAEYVPETPTWYGFNPNRDSKPCPWSKRFKLVRREVIWRFVKIHRDPAWKVAFGYRFKHWRCRCDWCIQPYKRHGRRLNEYKKAIDIDGL